MKLGFIGLGTMGLPMAGNLIKKGGYRVIGFDTLEVQRDKFIDAGGIITEDPINIYKSCEVVFLCMPNNKLVEKITLDIIEMGNAGCIIVDLSSTSPTLIRDLYEKAKLKNMHLLDSPVSGGEIGAINANLVMLCGGDEDIYNQVKPLLACMGTTVTLLGSSGSGDVAKLANNMIAACNIASIAEAFAYASKCGLNSEKFFEAIKGGFAGSTILNFKAPKMISHDFTPSARVSIHYKDLKNALTLANEMGIEIPLSNTVLNQFNDLIAMGCAGEDHAALSKWYEQKMDTTL